MIFSYWILQILHVFKTSDLINNFPIIYCGAIQKLLEINYSNNRDRETDNIKLFLVIIICPLEFSSLLSQT